VGQPHDARLPGALQAADSLDDGRPRRRRAACPAAARIVLSGYGQFV
jgi:hypothetical protein